MRALGVVGAMLGNHFPSLSAIGLVSLAAWSTHANADGGISALGGLLPIYIALWSIGFGIFVWFIFSLYVLFAAPKTQKGVKAYRMSSVALVCVILFAAIIGSAFLSIIVLIGAFLITIIMGAITALVLWRTQKRGNDT
jgi:hypothetical protein